MKTGERDTGDTGATFRGGDWPIQSPLQTIQHAGIPQGSPLAPSLHIFYKANLVESQITAQGGSIGFIDDYTAWAAARTPEESTQLLQSTIILRAEQWAQASGATFEADKTGLVHFTRPQGKTDGQTALQFQGHTIVPKAHFKVLGVSPDSGLQTAAHIEQVCASAKKKCLAMSRLRGMRFRQLRQLYQSVVLSTLLYRASTWFAQGRHQTWSLIICMEKGARPTHKADCRRLQDSCRQGSSGRSWPSTSGGESE